MSIPDYAKAELLGRPWPEQEEREETQWQEKDTVYTSTPTSGGY